MYIQISKINKFQMDKSNYGKESAVIIMTNLIVMSSIPIQRNMIHKYLIHHNINLNGHLAIFVQVIPPNIFSNKCINFENISKCHFLKNIHSTDKHFLHSLWDRYLTKLCYANIRIKFNEKWSRYKFDDVFGHERPWIWCC